LASATLLFNWAKAQLVFFVLIPRPEGGAIEGNIMMGETILHYKILGKLGEVRRVLQSRTDETSSPFNYNFVKGKFQWQDEYIAISVSESMVNKVRDYIMNQETHHKRKSFMEEYKEFMKKYETGLKK